VLTPEEYVALARTARGLTLHPLMGGHPPDLSWESLDLIASTVLPSLQPPAAPAVLRSG